jgi:ribosomal-protein-alanine N-acetyltransferase
MALPREIQTLRVQTRRLLLRPLAPNFAACTLDYHLRNREFFQAWHPRPRLDFYREAEQRRRLQTDLEEAQAGRMLRLWLFHHEDQACQQILGHITFSGIMWGAFRSCFLGYGLDQQATGQGYMTEALTGAIHLAFVTCRLHRLEANIMPTNQASIRVVEKLAFVCEGRSPRYLKINGHWEDHLRYVKRNLALE